MTQDKRDRQKENRRRKLEEEAAAYKRSRRNQRIFVFGGLALLIIIGVVVVGFFIGDDDSEVGSTSLPAETPETTLPGAQTQPTAPPAGETITGETPCPAADGSSPRTTQFENPPPMCIDPAKSYKATVSTTAGEFTIALDPGKAPQTVNNFVVLSRYHYYDGVPFHRVVKGFAVQGGDAVGTPLGTGGPGYSIPDELPSDVNEYMAGSVAMANSGPDTGGSQFFIYLGGSPLPGPDFSLFGQVAEGLDTTVKAIEDGGTEGEGVPTTLATINTIQIVES